MAKIKRNFAPANVTAHEMIANVAEAMAQELYEELAKDNSFYKVNEDRQDFVLHCAPKLRAAARSILGGMLARNDVSDIEKQQIHEALVKDNALPKHGSSAVKFRH